MAKIPVLTASGKGKAPIRRTNRIHEIWSGFTKIGTEKTPSLSAIHQSRPRNIARVIVNVIGPDHRTKGQRTHRDNIAAHNKKASEKSLPPNPLSISPRRSQGKNRALVGSGTIGGQVNQRTQSGIPGASAREGGIWPRNREGGRGRRRQRLARHDFSQ